MKKQEIKNIVLKEAAIVLLYILWQVGIEHKRWNRGVWQLGAVLNLDVLTLHALWWISLDDRQHHLVPLRGSNLSLAVLLTILARLQHTEDTLLGQSRNKEYRKINK